MLFAISGLPIAAYSPTASSNAANAASNGTFATLPVAAVALRNNGAVANDIATNSIRKALT
jgi:hypothetical protein